MITIPRQKPGHTPLYSFNDFLSILHPLQTMSRFVFLDFSRFGQAYGFANLKVFYIGLMLHAVDMVGNIVKIASLMQADRLSEAQQIGAVFSIEVLNFLRGLAIYLAIEQVTHICHKLEAIFPTNSEQQLRMHLPAMAEELRKRFSYLHFYASVGMLIFIIAPFGNFLLNYKLENGAAVGDEFHQHASWVPFGLKQDYRTYPVMYLLETYLTCAGISFLAQWDLVFSVWIAFLCLHYNYLTDELLRLDARLTQSPDGRTLGAYYNRLRDCLIYLDKLNSLVNEVNEVFKLPILVSDMITAGTICFNMYLLSNTDDYVAICKFTFPCLGLVFLTFDIARRGGLLEEATARVKEAIYKHNWCEGSIHYRKQVIRLLQQSNHPARLTGYHLFDVNMMHFQKMMTLAYQMFMFLQSRRD